MQINLNHCEADQDLLAQTVIGERMDAVVINEPYKIPEGSVWIYDKSKQATMWVCRKFKSQQKVSSGIK